MQRLTRVPLIVLILLAGLIASAPVASGVPSRPEAPMVPMHQAAWGWYDNDVLCETCWITQGNIVGLWESILWTNGVIGKCTSQYGEGAINGYFNWRKKHATTYWQQQRGLTADGVVGPATWSTAESGGLFMNDPPYNAEHFYYYWDDYYNRAFYLYGNDPWTAPAGAWSFNPPSNPAAWVPVTHPDITFYEC